MNQTQSGLNPRFWECECDERYIHHRAIQYCPRCEACQQDQPDGRLDEIAAQLQTTFTELQRAFAAAVSDILEAGYSQSTHVSAASTWMASAVHEKTAGRQHPNGSGTPMKDDDRCLEAAYEDRFCPPDNGEA